MNCFLLVEFTPPRILHTHHIKACAPSFSSYNGCFRTILANVFCRVSREKMSQYSDWNPPSGPSARSHRCGNHCSYRSVPYVYDDGTKDRNGRRGRRRSSQRSRSPSRSRPTPPQAPGLLDMLRKEAQIWYHGLGVEVARGI